MQVYDEMVDSDVEWIGKVPKSWDLTPIRYIFEPTKRVVGEAAVDFELLSLTRRGIIPRSEVEGGKNPANYDTYQVAKPDDLVMCLFDYDVTPRTVGRVRQEGMVTGAYTVLQPLRKTSSQFYYYFFLALDETKELLHLCTGLRNGLSKTTFFGLNVPNPEPETQQGIADFLDTETAKIDNLITTQEHLLQLLEEKRRATITHAVTRGLDPNVELKETNISWIGKIPTQWKLSRLKELCEINNGSDYKKIEADSGYPVMGSGGTFAYASEYVYDGESVLFGRKGTIDKPLYVKGRFWTVDTMFWSRIYPNTIAKYLYYAALYIPYDYYSTKTAIPSMTQSNLNNHKIAIPKLEEQKRVVHYLDDEQQKFELLKQKVQTQITLLRERRTSLISHAVTGKVKV